LIGKHHIPGTREENVSLMTLEQSVITALRTSFKTICFHLEVLRDYVFYILQNSQV
jgi:hypothetical protein